MRMTNTQALSKAAQIVKKQGWCRFKLQDEHRRVCLLGALNVALVNDPFAQELRASKLLRFVEKYLKKKTGQDHSAVILIHAGVLKPI